MEFLRIRDANGDIVETGIPIVEEHRDGLARVRDAYGDLQTIDPEFLPSGYGGPQIFDLTTHLSISVPIFTLFQQGGGRSILNNSAAEAFFEAIDTEVLPQIYINILTYNLTTSHATVTRDADGKIKCVYFSFRFAMDDVGYHKLDVAILEELSGEVSLNVWVNVNPFSK